MGERHLQENLGDEIKALRPPAINIMHLGKQTLSLVALSIIFVSISLLARHDVLTANNLQEPFHGGSFPFCPYYEDIPSPFPASFWKETLAMLKQSLNRTYETNEHAGLTDHLPYSRQAAALFKRPFYLFSSVREPVSQFHSGFVEKCLFQANNAAEEQGIINTTLIAEMRERLEDSCFAGNFANRTTRAKSMQENKQLKYLGDSGEEKEKLTVESVASAYDFLFVKERLHESLVAFAILFNVDFDDIAHVASKVRTGKYTDASQIPAEINELVRSKTAKDLALWEHANKLLDEHIVKINKNCGGEGYFREILEKFGQIEEAVSNICAEGYKEWYEEFGFNTTLSYRRDNGQAPRCRDHVVKNVLRKWEKEGDGVAVGGMIVEDKESEAKKNNKVSEHDGMGKQNGERIR
ncbi:hypothetical protein VYU27_005307 [Nannochloropsis oceanica]